MKLLTFLIPSWYEWKTGWDYFPSIVECEPTANPLSLRVWKISEENTNAVILLLVFPSGQKNVVSISEKKKVWAAK